ncbi:MAG TPA: branched-chain amino acid ABC transporter permease [bacterium]|nr:branched-chain amino acid ABC transporter permease [bacterium]
MTNARLTLGGAALAAAAVAAALLPVLTHSRAVLSWTFLVLLYIALAQSWNVLGGFSGQVNLGHAALFGLGALTTRFLWTAGTPIAAALGAGTGVAAATGVLIGAPALRLRGPYFAIGTLAVAEILRITAGNVLPEIAALPPRALAAYTLAPRYYLALGLAAVTTGAAAWIARSRFGRGLVAVREDEAVAESVGVNAYGHTLAAFVISSALAGAAGGVFAYYHVGFYPSFAFSPLWTFDPLLIVYLGGVGTVAGPIAGALVFLALREALALRLGELHLLIFGLLFIAIVIALPGGIVQAARGLLDRPRAIHTTEVTSTP